MSWLERPIGIDLGTTNSASAMLQLDGTRVVLAEDDHGRSIIPSLVGYDPDASAITSGYTAWNRRGLTPYPVASIKRKMGQPEAVRVGPQEMLPSEVSAVILAGQVSLMRKHLQRVGHPTRVERAVITVPAYFDAPQIEATREAGSQAGVEVLGLLQEPTAACIYLVWKRRLGDGTFLVYDLGGGTFDVSVIRSLYGEYQVLSIDGDNYLGGDDFDRRLAEHFRQHLSQRGYKLDLDVLGDDEDAVRFMLLTRLARTIKESLTSQSVVYIGQRDIFRDQDGELVTLEMELTREAWEEMMADLVESTIRCSHRALEQSAENFDVRLEDIDHVVLVGGSTKTPMVQRVVREAFCGEGKSKAEELTMESPDACVALGAAIHAANLGGVRVGADDPRVQVHITSPLATRRDRARLVGRLSGEAGDAVQTVLLRDDLSATLGVEELDGERRFRMADIPLPDDGTHPMHLDLMEESGATLVSLPVTFHRDVDIASTGSALSNPTVLAKDITLEVQRRGQLDYKVLLARGRTLPAEGRFRFFTGDQSGAVLLTLQQNRFPIGTVHLNVPDDLALGTPVDLEVQVDEKMVITATGQVAGHTFWATIQPPEPRTLDEWSLIERRMTEAEEVAGRLWGYELRLYGAEIPFLLAGIREAARTDPDKLRALVARLDDLLERLRGRSGDMVPGYDRFRRYLDNIRRLVLRQQETLGTRFEDWERRIDTLEEEGKAAWNQRDQELWTQLNTQAQALYETVSQEESRFVRTNSLEHVQDLYRVAESVLAKLRVMLDEITLPSSDETRRLRESARDALAEEVEESIGRPPVQALRDVLEEGPIMRMALDRIITEARQLEQRIAEVPSLGVVVSHDD